MEETVPLNSRPEIIKTDWTEDEKKILARIFISNGLRNAVVTRRLKSSCNPENSDFIDCVLSSPIWDKISSVLGEKAYQEMWKERFVFYETTGRLQLALNGTLTVGCTKVSQFQREIEEKPLPWPNYFCKGYNPSILINRRRLMKRKFCSAQPLLRSDFQTVCSMIEEQKVGVVSRPGDCLISSKNAKLLRKFSRQKFSLTAFKKRLRKHVERKHPLSSSQLALFMNDVFDAYVPRNLIGSKKSFERFKSNVFKCVIRNPNHPVRLGTLMKGLPSYIYPRNIFLAKFVLFVTTILGVKLLSELFYITESLRGKNLMFFAKRKWVDFENGCVQSMVASGVLQSVSRDPLDVRTSRLRIIHKPMGFRPLVFSSSRHKQTRHRLSVCNTLLKQLVSQVNPSYGKMLETLHSQWKNIPRVRKRKVYFVRTDLADAFQSVNHDKLQEILNRRLSAIAPVQVCRTFLYKHRGRSKSVLQFTTVKPRLSRKKLFIEAGRKVYTTSYLKAVIFQYIKQNYVTHDNKSVYQQIKGVPQGCYLSSVLCELYLSDMDDCYLNHLKNDEEVLVRGVDDYLYVTYNLNKANAFLNLVYSGISEYGITFQLEKTVTNLKCPMPEFRFYGYVFRPDCRKIFPDFSDWTDLRSRMRLNPRMTWRDLTERSKLISYIKLHRLILDPNYLDKFLVMRNIFLCTKIHAEKFHILYCFLLENCLRPPTFSDTVIPVLQATRLLCARVLSLNGGPGTLSYNEIKFIVLKAYVFVLGPKRIFQDVVAHLNVLINRLFLRGGLSSRTKKLVKSLLKAEAR